MPKQKYDEYGLIDRNYTIKCPKCKKSIYITFEEDRCPFCGTWICPDCLTVVNKNNAYTSECLTDMGTSLRVTCKKCGYDVVDTDIPIGFG